MPSKDPNKRRRSISISRTLYDRLRLYCKINGCSMSSVVEERIRPLVKLDPRPKKEDEECKLEPNSNE